MDNSRRLEYNWIPSPDDQIEQAYSLFQEWVDENPDQYTVQVSYPRSGRHWIQAMLDCCIFDKIRPLRWIEDEHKDAKYLSVHPMVWPKFDDRLKYVFVMRDPRDVILSSIKFRDGLWHKYFWDHQCDWYRHIVESFLRLNALFIRYERVCLYPEWELNRIIEFANLEVMQGRLLDSIRHSDGKQYESGEYEQLINQHGFRGNRRYSSRCLKWQRDKRFLEEEYHIMIWAKLKDIMLPFGYTYEGHSTNLLTR